MDETIDRDPAEFLFGKLASNLLAAENNSQIHPGPPSKIFELQLLFLQLMYIANIIGSGYLFFFYFTGSSKLFSVMMIFPFVVLSSIKSQLLYSKFAPDLETRMSRPTSFVVSQQLIIIAGSFIILSGFWVVLASNSSAFDPTTLFALTLLLLAIYLKIYSDIALSSLALGIGVIPSWGGIRNMFGNIGELIQVKGRFSTRLAYLRISLIVSVSYLLANGQPLYYIGIISLLFLYMTRPLEKRNAASLLLNARGWIQNLSPAIIPVKILEDSTTKEVKSTEHVPAGPNGSSKTFSEQLFGKKSTSSAKRIIDRGSRLSSYAAQTINRIANNIRNEQTSLPTNLSVKCMFCSSDVIKGSRFCPDCGSPIL